MPERTKSYVYCPMGKRGSSVIPSSNSRRRVSTRNKEQKRFHMFTPPLTSCAKQRQLRTPAGSSRRFRHVGGGAPPQSRCSTSHDGCSRSGPIPRRSDRYAPSGRGPDTTSYFLRPRAENSRDDLRHAVPVFGFCLQPALPGGGQTIVSSFAVVLRRAPFACDPTLMLQTIERRVERALLNLEALLGHLLDAQQDAIAMQRAEGNGFEDQHIESALQKVELFLHESVSPRSTRNVSQALLDCQGKRRLCVLNGGGV